MLAVGGTAAVAATIALAGSGSAAAQERARGGGTPVRLQRAGRTVEPERSLQDAEPGAEGGLRERSGRAHRERVGATRSP